MTTFTVPPLKPCPFCAGEAEASVPHFPMIADCSDVAIRCTNCEITGPTTLFDADYHTVDDLTDLVAEAAELWNNRPLEGKNQ